MTVELDIEKEIEKVNIEGGDLVARRNTLMQAVREMDIALVELQGRAKYLHSLKDSDARTDD